MITPLAEQLRPKSMSDIVGQDHLVGHEGLISRTIKSGTPLSILLWGPPGVGKTSIAKLYARAFSLPFKSISAVFSGTAEIKKVVKAGEDTPLFNSTTVLFVDEIHRFNKAQQDAFLPYLERGQIILVGATTENPSFHLNNALLSRMRVLTLKPLDDLALEKLITSYEEKQGRLPLNSEAREMLIHSAQGDGRTLFNTVETLASCELPDEISQTQLRELIQQRKANYDRNSDGHYQLISALHKSLRGSDPDAALYWLARMLEGGEDPLFLARRLIRVASEDIGLADPHALTMAITARDTYEMLGSPEGELALAQLVVYLALAPKSNAIYTAFKQAQNLAKDTTHLSPPKTIINAPTRLMKDMGFGKGYDYDHDTEHGFSGQEYFPDEIPRQDFYHPVERGFEREMCKRKRYFSKLKETLKGS
jgi:putative ATPase